MPEKSHKRRHHLPFPGTCRQVSFTLLCLIEMHGYDSPEVIATAEDHRCLRPAHHQGPCQSLRYEWHRYSRTVTERNSTGPIDSSPSSVSYP